MQPPAIDYAAQNADMARLVTASQSGDDGAVEEMLARFRPLLRARMHWLWQSVREDATGFEWADVEAQVHALFLSRLHAFRLSEGVFFPHYIARLLDLDARDWLRRQRRSHATPFSQLAAFGDEPDDDWPAASGPRAYSILEESEGDASAGVEHRVSLSHALQVLSPAQRDVIELCYARGLTESAAATHLKISRSAVRNRLHGAIERLRDFFSEDGAAHESATRTGRISNARREFVALLPLDYVAWRMDMAKDQQRPDLVGVGSGRPILLQGVFDFPATGLKTPQLLSPRLRYVVPPGAVAGIRFMRVGVTCDAMVCVSTVVNGLPHRLIPVAPNSAAHVPFAIVEPLVAGSEVEIHVASDKAGVVVIDVGCLEMPA